MAAASHIELFHFICWLKPPFQQKMTYVQQIKSAEVKLCSMYNTGVKQLQNRSTLLASDCNTQECIGKCAFIDFTCVRIYTCSLVSFLTFYTDTRTIRHARTSRPFIWYTCNCAHNQNHRRPTLISFLLYVHLEYT